jgi:nucleotide-binding universal stress UspA family protein
MAEIRSLLFPVDFSDQTYATAPFVEAMASRFGAKVTLFNVVPGFAPPISGESSAFSDASSDVVMDGATLMHDLAPRLDCAFRKEFAHLEVERVMELGEPAEAIASFANTQGVDLVMMPTRGDSPLRRLLLGSTTAKVVHDAQCPVWTSVHGDQPPLAKRPAYRTVLCAVDRTPESTPVMEWAASFAEQVGAALRFVHVISGSDGFSQAQSQPLLLQGKEFQQEAVRVIANLQKEADVIGPVSIVTGGIAIGVSEEAKKRRVDLVVIGRGRVHDTNGRFGKHANEIVRLAPCPVISV